MNLFRNIVNALITMAIFWLGNRFFPDQLFIQDNKALITATLYMFVFGYLFALIMLVSAMLIPLGIGCLTTALLIPVFFIITPVKLWALNQWVPGFEIHGFWTYVVLSIVLSIFSLQRKKETQQ